MIFWAIIWVLLLIILLFLMLTKWDKRTTVVRENWNFKIWTVWDSSKKFDEFISDFKSKNKSMSDVIFEITSFKNYEDYSLALNSAFIKGVSPDIFVLNNNETSLFEDKVYALSNTKIDIHKFRQDYKSIFLDDLIAVIWEWEEKKEYLKWIPVWYETLWVLYNRKFRLKRSDFNLKYSLNLAIRKSNSFDVVPLALGNWSIVKNSPDILAQEFLLNKVNSITSPSTAKTKETLAEYMEYGSEAWDNAFNKLFSSSKNTRKNDIDLFADNEVWAIITYPRIIEKLKTYGFNSRYLYAAAYPHRAHWDWPSLANYNYFVVNTDSDKKSVALVFMNFLNSDEWAETFLNKFKYYLPAKRTLEDKLWKNNISSFYPNIQLQDFYSDEPLSSFDKGNKVIYDKEIVKVLDNFWSYLDAFEDFKSSLLCKSEKILNLKNLSTSCE